MPPPSDPRTLYDSLGGFGGGVNAGDSPLDIDRDVMAGAINTTVTGKYASHRPCYYRWIVNYVNVAGQISATQTAVQAGVFQGQTEKVVLDDTGNAYIIALISGRVFSFAITSTTVTCTELLIYSPSGGTQQPITGGLVTGATVTGGIITGATISMSGTYTGTITGATITAASLSGGLVTAGTITGGHITSSANVTTAITTATFAIPAGQTSAGFVASGTITNVTLTGASVTGPAQVVQPQAWLWQTECWVIINDGVANPVVVNLNTQQAIRSNYGVVQRFSTTLSNASSVAPVGQTFINAFTSTANLSVGNVVTIVGTGTMLVTNIGAGPSNFVTLQTLTGNGTTNSGGAVYWNVTAGGLPPGRMGDYGLGRNWLSLVAAYQFIALDLVGGASGTPSYNFRDAVLQSTENTYIVGGGAFSIPGGNGPITAIKFSASPNTALGQGPLMVFNHKIAYSCQAPVDRLTWQSVSNPILTVSVLTNGAKGQWSTVVANSDMFYRAVDGVRSIALEELESNQWGDVPSSFEVSPTLEKDNLALVNFESAIVFGNRLLLSVGPIQSAQGVYCAGIVPLNFSPISSLRGKAPAVWDSGVWVGGGTGSTNQMQVLQLAVGEVVSIERAFALVLNTTASPNQIEFWEVLSDGVNTYDFDGTNQLPINWQFDSRSMPFGVPEGQHVEMFLSNGEIWVQNLTGTVSFAAYYKPDQFAAFQPWVAWQSKQTVDAANSQSVYQPRMGLGEPSGKPYDPSTSRPFRQAFTFQFRLSVTGHLVFNGAFFEAQTVPMRKFAPVVNQPL